MRGCAESSQAGRRFLPGRGHNRKSEDRKPEAGFLSASRRRAAGCDSRSLSAATRELLVMAEIPTSCALSSNTPAGHKLVTSHPAQKTVELGSWNMTGCQQEKAEWENLNKLLMRHGLKPVSVATPRNSKNLTDMIVLDKHSSLGIRLALKTLVEDTERQQKMMQGLIQANRQLRDEVRLERGRASRQEQHANNLEKTVENIKSKICQLEDETIAKVCQQQNQVKELQKDQHVSQTKFHQQQEKLHEQEETIAHLQKEIYKAGVEEQERITTQNKMFCQFCKRAPKSLLDQQFLCLIDYYESQINQMKKELRRYKKDEDHVQAEGKGRGEFLNLDATPNYRALLTSFQNQLIETKARNEQLQHENINFRKDLETRPTVQELKLYKHQVKKLEKTLKKNIKSREFMMGEKIKENKESEIITEDQLQAVCRQYLQVLSSIDSVLSSPRAPPLIYKRSKGPVQNGIKENGQECGFEHLPPTVEMWADQIMALKDLYRSLRKLSQELVPWHTIDIQDNSECIRVEDLQFIVDAILEEIENREKNSQMPSLQTLYAIVSHFQKLFDVSSLNGVYPRMNEVYTKLGEMTNAMRNLHDLLELDSSAPPTVLVDTVGKLCNIINENVNEQVEQLLGTQDIQSIISKLEEHEYFFPAFQALIQDLLCVLEISNLDDILPTVQNLKLLAR
ncbi:centrosomal protein of 70 kDa isoform X2 [Alligator mississippiensis]|uniref:centrosomal protein of 70 kDa isoform X2 n=1 Tax=Alligator mississippiensis TaxID=8496 RepID=UPI002877264E|nr:centrosomal protein of 70 kDa isoform X2 [Alligator mississippiensis]